MRKLKGVLIFLISSLTITGISFIDGQVWNLIFLAFGIITYAIVGILFSIGILRDRSSGKEAYAFIFILLILAGYGFIKALKAFKSGQKDIEMRLYDEKRRALKVNDELIFKCYPLYEEVRARIVDLHIYKNFAGLYNDFPKTRIGYKENEIASPRDMYKYCSDANIRKYCVVGIEIELMK